MKEYQKIETLLKFDSKLKKFLPEFFNPIVSYLSKNAWLASEKIDGMNIRVNWDGHRISWSGRTDKSELPVEVDALLHEKFDDTEIVFEQIFENKEVTLYMEAYGGKIQGGNYGGKERLIGFDVEVNDIYLDKKGIKQIFDQFDVKTVEFFYVVNLQQAVDIVTNSVGPSKYNVKGAKTPMEGLVVVPAERIYDHLGNRIIVKIKSKDLSNVYQPEKKSDRKDTEKKD